MIEISDYKNAVEVLKHPLMRQALKLLKGQAYQGCIVSLPYDLTSNMEVSLSSQTDPRLMLERPPPPSRWARAYCNGEWCPPLTVETHYRHLAKAWSEEFTQILQESKPPFPPSDIRKVIRIIIGAMRAMAAPPPRWQWPWR